MNFNFNPSDAQPTTSTPTGAAPAFPGAAPAFPAQLEGAPAFPVQDTESAPSPTFPPAPVDARQRPQDEWTPRPGVLMDYMTLLVMRRREAQRVRQEYLALLDRLRTQHPELVELEQRIGETGRADDEVYHQVEEMARQAKTSCQVPGCKVSYSSPKTKVCAFTDLVAAWPSVDTDCPEVIKRDVDIKALEAAEKAGRTPPGICARVVTEKSATSNGRLKIEVEL